MKWNFWKKRETPPAPPPAAGGARVQVTGPSFDALPSAAPEVRDPAAAMKIAAVYRCVRIVSDSIAKLPLQYQRLNRPGGYYVDFPESPTWRLLSGRPNRWQGPFLFMRELVQQVLLLGNAYVYPRRSSGHVTELVLLSPGSVALDTLLMRYTVADLWNGVSGTFGPEDLIHVRNVSLDGGRLGLSTVSFAARTLGIASAGDRETGSRFATGGKVKAIYHQETDGMKGFSSGAYADGEMRQSADDIERRLNSGRQVIHVPGAGKLEPLSMTSQDMQFLESRKFTVTEVARFFGVPKSKVMDDSNANYKSVELVNLDFYSDALAPLMRQIEQEFESHLVPAVVSRDYRIRFDLRALYQTDLLTRADIDAKELANGLRTVNELRRREGLAPVEGGDRPLVTANLLPLETLGAQKPASGDSSGGGNGGSIEGASGGAQKTESEDEGEGKEDE